MVVFLNKVDLVQDRDLLELIELEVREFDEACAGDNVGLRLRGIGKDALKRGMVIARPASVAPRAQFEAHVVALSKEEGGRHTPIFSGFRPPARWTCCTPSFCCRATTPAFGSAFPSRSRWRRI